MLWLNPTRSWVGCGCVCLCLSTFSREVKLVLCRGLWYYSTMWHSSWTPPPSQSSPPGIGGSHPAAPHGPMMTCSQQPLAGGNEAVQRLCGEHGIARGKEKYTVARSENTTAVGVILYYQNQVTPPGQPGPVVLSSARDKAREPSHSGNR